jgi:hypothetical protein
LSFFSFSFSLSTLFIPWLNSQHGKHYGLPTFFFSFYLPLFSPLSFLFLIILLWCWWRQHGETNELFPSLLQ